MRAPGRKSSNCSASRRWGNNPPSVRPFADPAPHCAAGLTGTKAKKRRPAVCETRPGGFIPRGTCPLSLAAGRRPCLPPSPERAPPSWPVGLSPAFGKSEPFPALPAFHGPLVVIGKPQDGHPDLRPADRVSGPSVRPVPARSHASCHEDLAAFGTFPLPESEPFPTSQLLFLNRAKSKGNFLSRGSPPAKPRDRTGGRRCT